MMTGDKCESTFHALRRSDSSSIFEDRINVPRDMPIYNGRYMREALEEVASMYSSKQVPRIPIDHRRDQNPQVSRKKINHTINDCGLHICCYKPLYIT